MIKIDNNKLEVNNMKKKILDDPIEWLIQQQSLLLGISILISLVGILSFFLNFVQSKIGATLISLGITYLIINIVQNIKNKELTEKDERIREISIYSLGYSWILTLVAMVVLLWLSISGIFVFKGTTLFAAMIFIMMGTTYFFNMYFREKGVPK